MDRAESRGFIAQPRFPGPLPSPGASGPRHCGEHSRRLNGWGDDGGVGEGRCPGECPSSKTWKGDKLACKRARNEAR
jgi:hypothetical protein